MFRSGFLLSVSGPAAVLTLLIQPAIRDAADQWSPPVAIVQPAAIVSVPRDSFPEGRIVSTAISPTRVAGIPSTGPRPAPSQVLKGRTASEKDAMKVRRPMQEGCERAISSLAGPEARRMMPGRCMT